MTGVVSADQYASALAALREAASALETCRNERDEWRRTAARSQRRVGDLEAEIARLKKQRDRLLGCAKHMDEMLEVTS